MATVLDHLRASSSSSSILVLAKTIRIIPQARAGIVERFGKYRATLRRG